MKPGEVKKGICAILTGALVVLSGCSAPASESQPKSVKPRTPPPLDQAMANMKEYLNLNAEQVSQITSILKEAREKERVLEQEAASQGLGRNDVSAAIKELRKNTDARIAQYLTPEQLQLFNNRVAHRPPQ